MPKEDFISVDLQLPVYTNELNKAEEVISKLTKKLDLIVQEQTINGKNHTEIFDEITKVLLYVGNLSEPAFKVEEQLEELYIKKFIHSPALAKQLWLEHYEYIHHPYNLLKNRCFRLIDELDAEYFRMYKTPPPNWNLKK